MSKKKLLEESTVRKFMKFANLGHLAESFVDEAMYEDDMEADVLPPEAGEEPEMDMEEPMEEPEAGNEELLARVVQAVADELGVEAEVEGAGAEEPEMEEPEMEEPEMEPEMEEPEMEPEMEEPEMDMEEEPEEIMEMDHAKHEEGMGRKKGYDDEVMDEDEDIMEVIDEEAVIEEVMKRVIARVAAKK
mgnify:CR=1 FL=1